jgi:hypothetical protein
VADFNGDGKLDLAVVNIYSDSLSLLLGNGNGTFQAAGNPTGLLSIGGSAPNGVAVGDFNGDGLPDLAIGVEGSSNVAVLLNQGLVASATVSVSPAAAASHFLVAGPARVAAGNPFLLTVMAEDQSNNIVTTYTGTVAFTSSDSLVSAGNGLPTDATLTNGQGVFTVTLKTVGSQALTVTDIVSGSIAGSTGPVVVSAGPATHFVLSDTPAITTAGIPFSFTVTAEDQSNNTATGFTGTVHFTSSDPQVIASNGLPGDATLVNGQGVFTATLRTAGDQTLTAADTVSTTVTAGTATITVSAAATSHFGVFAPASATAGSGFSFTVLAEDPFNNLATGYNGTVAFATLDTGPSTVLPAAGTLVGGLGTFSATLTTSGSQTLWAIDAVAQLSGHSGPIAVSAAPASHFGVIAPKIFTVGRPLIFTVIAEDRFNNIASDYAGTVHFTSTDPSAVLPHDTTLANGAAIFGAIFNAKAPGKGHGTTIAATDTVNPDITGTSGVIQVKGKGHSKARPNTDVAASPAAATISMSPAVVDQVFADMVKTSAGLAVSSWLPEDLLKYLVATRLSAALFQHGLLTPRRG